MNLKQLRILNEVSRQSLNISSAAVALNTSQPGVSRQIQLLEQELGIEILVRQKNRVIEFTEVGRMILQSAERILHEADNIAAMAAEARHGGGRLTLATSHLHARYTLLGPCKVFCARHPEIELRVLQAMPDEIPKIVESGEAEIGVSTAYDAPAAHPKLLTLGGEPIRRSVIMPRDHRLAAKTSLELKDLAAYPIVGYTPNSRAGRLIAEACGADGVSLRFVVSASDCDVIKTYVAEGLGIGIVPSMSIEPGGGDFHAVEVSHLLPRTVTSICVRRDIFLRRYMADFITMIAPRWDRRAIKDEMEGHSGPDRLRPGLRPARRP